MVLDWFRYAFAWANAARLSSVGRYEESSAVLNAMPRKHRESRISPDVLALLNDASIGRHEAVVRRSQDILDRIDNEKPKDDTSRYMRAYVEALNRMALNAPVEEGVVSVAAPDAVEWEKINLDRVPASVKRVFPLRMHPKWEDG